MDFFVMLKKLETFGYQWTDDYFVMVAGKRRRFYRFDFFGGPDLQRLQPAELRERIPGITVYVGAHEYAPELSFILVCNHKF